MAAPRLDQQKTGAIGGSSAPHAILPPGRYEIDTSYSAVTFSTRHLFGLAPVRGSFAIRTGTVHVAQPLSDSSVHVEIETASFRTGNRQRDRTVLSAALLDADQYPVMTFRASQVDGPALAGMLTAHGLSRPVTLPIELSEVSSRSFTARASIRIDRAEFGVTAYRGLAGRYLELSVEARCVRS
jgi:polyisoprenoid-binding protein YceI